MYTYINTLPPKWLKFAWIFIFAFMKLCCVDCFLLFSSSYETLWNASRIFISSRAKIWMTQEFKGRVHKKKNQSWQLVAEIGVSDPVYKPPYLYQSSIKQIFWDICSNQSYIFSKLLWALSCWNPPLACISILLK